MCSVRMAELSLISSSQFSFHAALASERILPVDWSISVSPRVILVRVVVFGILQSADLLAGGWRRRRSGSRPRNPCRAVLGAVAQRFVAHLDVIFHVDQVVARDGARGDSDVALVRNADFVLLALLGRDDDDAVGSAGAVERTCRCVLSTVIVLDVRGGLIALSDPSKGMPSTTYSGVAESVHRLDAADDDRCRFARLAAAGGDLHAGYGSFERFGDVAHDRASGVRRP